MASEKGSKLNRLHQLLPEGLLVDAAWLERHGYSHPLRQKYVASRWLLPLARGVYQRPPARLEAHDTPAAAGAAPAASAAAAAEESLDWQLVVLSLQNLLDVGVSVGGRTALELHGVAHYLSADAPREVHLYTSEDLPGWLTKIPVNARWALHKADRLFVSLGRGLDSLSRTVSTGRARQSAVTRGDSDVDVSWGHWHWPLTLSTPERALLELLDELPNKESFEQVDALFDGLGTLMPRRLQRLLEACQSVKVKRLFLFFAERHNHAWLKLIERKRIDLGAGKRALVPGGRLDTKYGITVPESLLKNRDGL